MNTVLSTAMLGFDSFVACLITAPLMPSRRFAMQYVLLFGFCDALGTATGGILGFDDLDVAMWPFYLAAVVLVSIVALKCQWRVALVLLPWLLAMDNFFEGGTMAEAYLDLISSSLMAGAGLAVGWALYTATRKAITKWV